MDGPEIDAVAHAAATGGLSVEPKPDSGLRRAEDREPNFRTVAQSMSDALVIADHQNRIVYCNPAIESVLGWRPEDLVGRHIVETLVPERLRKAHGGGFARFASTGRSTIMGRAVRLPALTAAGGETDIDLVLSPAPSDQGEMFVAGILRDVQGIVMLEKHSALAIELLDVLAQPASFDETTSKILRTICETLDWDAGVLWMLDRRNETLQCADFWSNPGVSIPRLEEASRKSTFTKGAGLPGRVWKMGEPSWIERISDDENFFRAPIARSENIQSAFAFPITRNGDFVGVIEFFSTDPRFESQELLSTVTAIGGKLGDLLASRVDADELARSYQAEAEARRGAEEARAELALLLDASSVLSGSLDPTEALERLGRLVIGSLADVCLIDLVDAAGSIRRVVAAHRNPQMDEVIKERMPSFSPDPAGDNPAARVIREARAEYATELNDEFLREITRGPEHLDLARQMKPLSYMSLPLLAGGKILGALTLITTSDSERRYGTSELRLAEELSRRAAVALETARLFKERSEIAATLQQSLLPPDLPLIPGVEIEALYRAGGEGEVGGDFYDVMRLNDHEWCVVIGDVCGKGIPAASLTALVRHSLRAAAISDPEPSSVLNLVNEAIIREGSGQFCTLLYTRLWMGDGRYRLTLASAGHPPPVLVRSTSDVQPVRTEGSLLGVLTDPEPKPTTIDLEPGDAFVMYTDGLSDMLDRSYSTSVRRVLAGSGETSASGILAKLEELAEGAGEPHPDDVAVVVFKIRA